MWKEVWKLQLLKCGQMEKHSQKKVQTWGASEGRRLEREKIREGETQKREDAGERKGRKVGKHSVFSMFCWPWGSKIRFAKAAGAEPAGQMRDDELHVVAARSTFPSQSVKTTAGVKPILDVR